jgi:diguanylate cyclase (GGDEF)-like protein
MRDARVPGVEGRRVSHDAPQLLTSALPSLGGDAPDADGTNRESALRFNRAMWVCAAVALPIFALVFPPTVAIGPAGWAAAGAWMALHLGVIAWLYVRRERVTMRFLLATQYVEIAFLGLLQWLAGGWEAPYHQLVFVHMINVALTHPRRYALPCMGLALLVVWAPAAYGGTDGRLSDVAVMAVLWTAVTGFALAVMERVRQQRLELSGEARSDALTELDNRRAFDESSEVRLDAARAAGRSLVVGIGDVDRFKSINDRFGHQAGDDCLRAVADALRSECRRDDRVFRWGGDEFAVLLEAAEPSELDPVLRRFEDAVATRVRDPEGESVRLTVGWGFDTGDVTATELVAAADAALLSRKPARAA